MNYRNDNRQLSNNGYSPQNTAGGNNGFPRNSYPRSEGDTPGGDVSNNNGAARDNTRVSDRRSQRKGEGTVLPFVEKLKHDGYEKKKIYKRGTVVITAALVLKTIWQIISFIQTKSVDSVLSAVVALLFFTGIPAIFLFGGWWEFVLSGDELDNKRKKYSQTVMATLYDYKTVIHNGGEKTTYSYYAKYKFKYNNTEYDVTSEEQYVGSRDIMLTCKLMIDPENPMDIYEVEEEYGRKKTSRELGIIMMVIGTFLYLVMRI